MRVAAFESTKTAMHFLLLPEGTLPEDLAETWAMVYGGRVPLRTFDLSEESRVVGLDPVRALHDLESMGFHATRAVVRFDEVVG